LNILAGKADTDGVRTDRTHVTGAFHSRTIEKRMAAAKSANRRRFLLIASIIARG
jgi:hypothetical protein